MNEKCPKCGTELIEEIVCRAEHGKAEGFLKCPNPKCIYIEDEFGGFP